MKDKIIFTIGALLIIYFIVLTSIMGLITFSQYLLALGVAMVIYPSVNKALGHNKIYIAIKRITKPLIAIGLVVFIVVSLIIFSAAIDRNTDEADYIIVLGAGLRGERMTITLEQRVKTALTYYTEIGNADYIVVSGGQGRGESISEALAMKRYLVSNGVSEDKVLMEDKSTSTEENLKLSASIIEEHSGKKIDELKIKIITSDFHCFRAKNMAKRLGFTNITTYGAKIRAIFIPTYYAREFCAVVKTIVIDSIIK